MAAVDPIRPILFGLDRFWAHGLGGEDAHSQKREVLNGVIPLERESPDTAPFFFTLEHTAAQ